MSTRTIEIVNDRNMIYGPKYYLILFDYNTIFQEKVIRRGGKYFEMRLKMTGPWILRNYPSKFGSDRFDD